MKIRKMGWFLSLFPISGISLAPIAIYFRKEEYFNDERRVNHESIHWHQQMEMLIIFFYLWYLIEFLIKFLYYWSWYKTYINLSFEREAYKHDDNLDYLLHRKWFSWMKYIFKK